VSQRVMAVSSARTFGHLARLQGEVKINLPQRHWRPHHRVVNLIRCLR